MPLFSPMRLLTMALSLAVAGIAIYLALYWYQGDLVRLDNGDVVQRREDWLIWVAAGLGLFSLLGRLIVAPTLAKPDRAERSVEDRGNGTQIAGQNNSSLYVEDLGNETGPTLILTHGWAMDSTIWHYAKLSLGRRFRIIVWDLPGLGQSKGPISLENFAECLASVISWSGAERVVLVGHSIGGMTIQTLARDHAALFERHVVGIALLNTTYINPLKTMILPRFMQAIRWPILEPMMWLGIILQPLVWLCAWQSYFSGMAHVANRIGFGKYVTRSQLNHVTLLSTKNPPGNIDRGNLAMFRWDATGALSRSDVPALVLGGEVDIVTKPSASHAIAQQAAKATVEVVEGVNHMGMLERADHYNSRIAVFAEQVFARG